MCAAAVGAMSVLQAVHARAPLPSPAKARLLKLVAHALDAAMRCGLSAAALHAVDVSALADWPVAEAR